MFFNPAARLDEVGKVEWEGGEGRVGGKGGGGGDEEKEGKGRERKEKKRKRW